MRFLTWSAGLVVGATVFAAGAMALTHHQAAPSSRLTASYQAPALISCCANDPMVAAPHKPVRSPVPAAAAPAPPDRVAVQAPPAPTVVVSSTQQALINQDRARGGLPPLTWSSCLFGVASGQAAHLATPGVAFQHYGGAQQSLNCGLGRQAGENIGWYSAGPNDGWMNSKFVASPDHYANIMGPYHYVATAWVVASNGYGYIAVEFG